ncbi:MAG TPA: hypothetical protein PLJ42_11425 [Chitinophagales bacterium]|jgi:antitoxin component YwqK of YwqJK toxin-antitoxin module|nr:hypothetical protein [Chitinophagales bacterium]HQW80033.1 hypothetical protein [Chitinophagales bacterium]HRB18590.1 hypothetical protein [Chitinophagales bacterium]HRB66467.1 hypothetical protein [Chitinophagales bacterium]HRB91849.1 hypothetical protein [Chitinophagales bacterium]
MNNINLQLNVSINQLFILFLLTTFSACSSKKQIEIKNKENVVIESYFVDKKNPEIKIGEYKRFYDDGKIMEISIYLDGKLNGKRTLYYPSGKIMQEENYVDNKFEGLFKTYFDDGSIQQEGLYKDNMMTGIWKNYFQEPKNKVKEEITLKDNHISGMYKEYYPNGNIYAVGNKKEILDDMDVFDGEVTLFDSLENNKPIRKLIFENGKQISKEDI